MRGIVKTGEPTCSGGSARKQTQPRVFVSLPDGDLGLDMQHGFEEKMLSGDVRASLSTQSELQATLARLLRASSALPYKLALEREYLRGKWVSRFLSTPSVL